MVTRGSQPVLQDANVGNFRNENPWHSMTSSEEGAAHPDSSGCWRPEAKEQPNSDAAGTGRC